MKKWGPRPTYEEAQRMLEDGSIFEKYEKMVFKLAHGVRAAHPRYSFDELVSEGIAAIYRYTPDYDPSRASLTTFLYSSIWSQMKDSCIDPKVNRLLPTDFTNPTFNPPAPEGWLTILFRELGEDARCLVTAALEAPGELQDVIRTRAPKASASALRNYMKSVAGWDEARVHHAWEEVRACL